MIQRFEMCVKLRGEWVRFDDIPAWQPIATAPKDGESILGWSRVMGHAVLKWEYEEWHLVDDMVYGCDDTRLYVDGPTHWMPLPDEPKL